MNIVQSLNQLLALFIKHAPDACVFVGLIWLIHFINSSMRGLLNILGIMPRKPFSLILGPIASTYLHADIAHIAYNSLPLFVMTATLFTHGIANGLSIIIAISYLEGVLVWCFARPGNHIGASGLIMGLFSYFLYMGYYNPSAQTLITALILLYYFGTLLLSIFPEDTLTSFEGHLAGLVSGLIIAHYSPPLFLKVLVMPAATMLHSVTVLLFNL